LVWGRRRIRATFAETARGFKFKRGTSAHRRKASCRCGKTTAQGPGLRQANINASGARSGTVKTAQWADRFPLRFFQLNAHKWASQRKFRGENVRRTYSDHGDNRIMPVSSSNALNAALTHHRDGVAGHGSTSRAVPQRRTLDGRASLMRLFGVKPRSAGNSTHWRPRGDRHQATGAARCGRW